MHGPRETRGRRGAGAVAAAPGITKEEIDGVPYVAFPSDADRNKFQELYNEKMAAEKRITEFKKFESDLNERRSRKMNPSAFASTAA